MTLFLRELNDDDERWGTLFLRELNDDDERWVRRM